MFGQGRWLGAIAALVGALSSAPALANPFIIENQQSELQFTSVFALPYWYSFDSTSKDLSGLTNGTYRFPPF